MPLFVDALCGSLSALWWLPLQNSDYEVFTCLHFSGFHSANQVDGDIESELVTHDFSIPFACPRSHGGKQLRVILLAPSALEDGCRQETISRLDRFSSLTGGRDVVIAFLQSEEPDQGSRYTLHGLLDLQSMFVFIHLMD